MGIEAVTARSAHTARARRDARNALPWGVFPPVFRCGARYAVPRSPVRCRHRWNKAASRLPVESASPSRGTCHSRRSRPIIVRLASAPSRLSASLRPAKRADGLDKTSGEPMRAGTYVMVGWDMNDLPSTCRVVPSTVHCACRDCPVADDPPGASICFSRLTKTRVEATAGRAGPLAR